MEPTAGTYEKLIDALSSNPALLLLALVLAGGMFLIYKSIPVVMKPITDIAESSKRLAEDVNDIKGDLSLLQRDVAVVVEKVSSHEIRLNRLEDK